MFCSTEYSQRTHTYHVFLIVLNRGKGVALTACKNKRKFRIMSKEKKEEYRELCRQRTLQHSENKKLLAQGLVTKEDLQRKSKERKEELKRKREEKGDAKNQPTPPPMATDESSGEYNFWYTKRFVTVISIL